MKKILISLLILGLAGLNLYLCYLVRSSPRQQDRENTDTFIVESLKAQFDQYISLWVDQSIRHEGRYLPVDLHLVKANDSIVELQELIAKGPLVVADFRNLTCQVCVVDELIRLSQLGNRIGKDHIALLYDFSSPRERVTFEMNNGLLTYLDSDTIWSGTDSEPYPKLFVVDQHSRIHDLYIPNKDLPELSDVYFRQITMKHFN